MSTPEAIASLGRLLNIVGPEPISPTDVLRPQLPGMRPGEFVSVYVLNNLPNGRYHVLVKDQLLDLNLPNNAEPGEVMELKVERNDGRLQFSIPNQTPANSGPTSVSLSPTARLLTETLQSTQTQEPAHLTGTQPLSEAEPQAAPLAENLRQTIRDSGLFYESHQQQWVQGQKPLADLLREPQAQLGQTNQTLVDAKTTALTQDTINSVLQGLERADIEQLPENLRDLARNLKAGAATGLPTATMGELPVSGSTTVTDSPSQRLQQRLESLGVLQTAKSLISPQGLDTDSKSSSVNDVARMMARPEVQHMVQQQLQALETHHLMWQGPVWPGQNMDWEIVGRREQDGGGSNSDDPTHWTTRLALDLPNLGRVVARLQLHQGQVSLKFMAENADTVAAMRSNQDRLQGQFSSAQLTLTGAIISQGSEVPDEP